MTTTEPTITASTEDTTTTDLVSIIQVHLHGTLHCMDWTEVFTSMKLKELATDLLTFIEQGCNCSFPSTFITRSRFICHPPPHPQHHVTYRASIAPTGQLNRTELEAVLREWLAVHRAILLQGELLSVDNTCPIIINSFDDEQCTHDPITTTLPTSDTHQVMVSLSVFMSTVLFTAVLAAMVVVVIVISFCALYKK